MPREEKIVITAVVLVLTIFIWMYLKFGDTRERCESRGGQWSHGFVAGKYTTFCTEARR
jgi:hypothetical protein